MKSTFKQIIITKAIYEPMFDVALNKYRPEFLRMNKEIKEFVYDNINTVFSINESVFLPELNDYFVIQDIKRDLNGDVIYESVLKMDTIKYLEQSLLECDELNKRLKPSNNKAKQSLLSRIFQ